MLNTLLIFLGAGFGGVSRYWIANITHTFLNHEFPYGTLMVNMSGCLLMGFLFVAILERFNDAGDSLRCLVLIGFLGGYTTFSSFSIETLVLFESGAYVKALLNILFSTTLCLTATWLGIMGARQL